MRLTAFLVVAAVLGGEAGAKPLITSSEVTFGRACLDFEESYDRMVSICEAALGDAQAGDGQKLDYLDNLGTSLLNLDRVDEAEQRYRELLALNETSVLGLNGLGWVARERDDYAQALAMFRKSVAQSPSVDGLAGMGAMLIETGAATFEDGMRYIDAALAINPSYRWAHREKGWRYLDQDLPEQAEAAFRAALEIYDSDANALRGLSKALRLQERFEEALTAINRALEVAPESYWSRDNRALILFKMERYAQSQREAEDMVAQRPGSASGYVRQARALEALGRRKKALAVLEAAHEPVGFSGYLIYWHADMLANEERWEDAEAMIRRTVVAEEADGSDYQLLAYITLESKAWDRAREAVDAALALNAEAEWGIYYDALLMLHDKEPDRAMDRFEEAIALGLPEHRVGYFAERLIAEGFLPRALVLRARILNRE